MDIQLQDSRLDSVALTRLVRGTLKDEPLPAYAMGCPVLSTPIFFVTAHTERFPEPGLLAAGGDRVIVKPVDFVKLNLALANLNASQATQRLTRG